MPSSLQPEFLLPATLTRPEDEALRDPTRSTTWVALEHRGRRLARALRDLGLEGGDRVGMLARNRIEWADLVVGSARAGTRYVPLNWHCAAPELTAMLSDAGVRVLLVDPEWRDVAAEAADAAGVEHLIELGEEYEGWLASADDRLLPIGPLGAPMQFTGGTTGRSRGVLRPDTTGTTEEFAAVAGRWASLTGMPEEGRVLLTTPAYHALGGALLRSALARGLPLRMLAGWDPVQVLRTIEAGRITATAMVPTQFVRLLKLDPAVRERFDVSSLRWVLHTAAPCPAWAKQAMIDWFGPVVVELYGSSEGAGPFVCTAAEWLQRPGTVGRPAGSLTVSILDGAGRELPAGEVGTIYVGRPDGPPAYFGDDEKTAAMRLPDGRFTVGDMGWVDPAGYLYLADRRVDLIITGGSNVYPAEVEAVISRHADVADVAVFGVPDAEWGQVVVAVVEPTAGSELDADTIRAYCRDQLASFKVPRAVHVVAELPRETSGKLKKHLLRDRYAATGGAELTAR